MGLSMCRSEMGYSGMGGVIAHARQRVVEIGERHSLTGIKTPTAISVMDPCAITLSFYSAPLCFGCTATLLHGHSNAHIMGVVICMTRFDWGAGRHRGLASTILQRGITPIPSPSSVLPFSTR